MTRRERPWWLETGDAQCATCLTFHHVEAEVRCEGCDEALCASCVVEVRRARVLVLCAACADEEGDG